MPAGLAIPLLIGQVAGAVIGSKAAKGAAKTQTAAGDRALALQQQQYDQSRQDFAPYQHAGSTAVGQLGQMATQKAPQFNPSTPMAQQGQMPQTVGQMGAPQAAQVRVQAPTGEVALMNSQQAQAAVAKGARILQ